MNRVRELVGASAAYRLGYDGTGVGVAVLDSGIDPQHPDLKGRMVYSYNYIGRNQDGADDCGHGTHICGIIGGTGTASGGRYQGLAPGCHFVSLKVLDRMGNGNRKQSGKSDRRRRRASTACFRKYGGMPYRKRLLLSHH